MLALSSVSLASPASARALLPSPDTLRSSEPCIPTCLREYESCVAAVGEHQMCRSKLDSGEGRLAEAGCTPGCEMERPIAFIHISKTGGSSVCEALEQCKLKPSQFPDREAGKDEGAHQHSWRDYLAFAEETDADMRNAVAFAVVRDPYARMVSWFYYLLVRLPRRCRAPVPLRHPMYPTIDPPHRSLPTSAGELLRAWRGQGFRRHVQDHRHEYDAPRV